MAFQIKRGESLRHAVTRMADNEIDLAGAALTDRRPTRAARPNGAAAVARVHDARTALKKARALTRLVGPAVGRAARAADQELRDIGRRLAPARDAEVLIETFDRVERSAGARGGRKIAEARAVVAALAHEHRRALAGARQRALVVRLGRARRRVARWAPDDNRWHSLAPGLVAAYRRSRQRMKKAYALDKSDAFHAWRRAVKTHRHQMHALEPLWPAEMDVRRDGLERLGDLLGEEHDLSVLARTLRAQRLCHGDDDDSRRFLAALKERRRQLRAEARPLGQRLFAEQPVTWARRLRAYFRAFRREDPAVAAQVVTRPPRSGRAHHDLGLQAGRVEG